MSKSTSLVPLLLLLLLTWFLGAWMQHKYCCSGNASASTPAVVPPAVTGDDNYCGPWELSDEENFHQSANHYLQFLRGEADVLDYDDDASELLYALSTYFSENPSQLLVLTGLYGEDETYEGDFSNLGLARANAVKNLLEDLGADSGRITMEAASSETYGYLGDTLCRGVEFGLTGEPEKEVTPESIGADLEADGLTLYFDFSSDDPNFKEDDREVLDALIGYLDAHPEAHIRVDGHTDDVGSAGQNQLLSRQRARQIRTYITGKDIRMSRVSIKGFGEDSPIADNETEEGRRLNRRVEVQLIK